MNEGDPTGYSAVPPAPTAYPPPAIVDIEGYQPAAPSSYPQVVPQPPPPAYAPPSKLATYVRI